MLFGEDAPGGRFYYFPDVVAKSLKYAFASADESVYYGISSPTAS